MKLTQRETMRQKQRDRDTRRQRNSETETQGYRETARQRHQETEKQRDRDTTQRQKLSDIVQKPRTPHRRSPGGERRRKRQRSPIYDEAGPLFVNQTNVGTGSKATWGGLTREGEERNMGFPECLNTILFELTPERRLRGRWLDSKVSDRERL